MPRWHCALSARGPLVALRGPLRHSSSLAGSAPGYKAHLVLHSGTADSEWPKQIDDHSRIHAAICKLAAPGQPLEGIGIGYSSRAVSPQHVSADASESLSATLYPSMREVPFAVTEAGIAHLAEYVASQSADGDAPRHLFGDGGSDTADETHIYVCTHGARDCRCGEIGGAFYDALASEVRRRRLSNVSVRRIAHVGGHKWAANAIVYPSGDWYGLLRPEDAPALLDAATNPSSSSVWWSRWRGRTGLSQLEQQALHAASAFVPAADAGALALSMRRDRRAAVELGDPVEVKFRKFEGETLEARGFEGERLMDVAKRHGLVQGTCGGQCECATCALDLVNGQPAGLAAPSEEELDQLEFALVHTPRTRLACQIPLNKAFAEWTTAGGIVQLPRF